MDLPNNGIVFRFIAIASNIPSHNIIGTFQLIRYSNPIISFLLHLGALYLRAGSISKDLDIK